MSITSWKTSQTQNNEAFGDGNAWNNLSNITVSDDQYSSCSIAKNEASDYLNATNFGFSIPSTATIQGIEVQIELKSDTTDTTSDQIVQLLVNGSRSGDNKAISDSYPTTDVVRTYGGTADTWGLNLTPADVNSTDFGISIQSYSSGKASVAYIDYVAIRITYSENGITVIHDTKVEIKTNIKPVFDTSTCISQQGDNVLNAQGEYTGGATLDGDEKFSWTNSSSLSCDNGIYIQDINFNKENGKTYYAVFEPQNVCVPDTVEINGIEAIIRQRTYTSGQTVLEDVFKLYDGTNFSSNKANTNHQLPENYEDRTIGSPTDTWGLTITPDNIGNISLYLKYNVINNSNQILDVLIDCVSFKIYYTVGGTSYTATYDTKTKISSTITINQDTKTSVLSTYQLLQDTKAIAKKAIENTFDTLSKILNSISQLHDTKSAISKSLHQLHDTNLELSTLLNQIHDTNLELSSLISNSFDTKTSISNQISQIEDTLSKISNSIEIIADTSSAIKTSIQNLFDTKVEVSSTTSYIFIFDTKTQISNQIENIYDTLSKISNSIFQLQDTLSKISNSYNISTDTKAQISSLISQIYDIKTEISSSIQQLHDIKNIILTSIKTLHDSKSVISFAINKTIDTFVIIKKAILNIFDTKNIIFTNINILQDTKTTVTSTLINTTLVDTKVKISNFFLKLQDSKVKVSNIILSLFDTKNISKTLVQKIFDTKLIGKFLVNISYDTFVNIKNKITKIFDTKAILKILGLVKEIFHSKINQSIIFIDNIENKLIYTKIISKEQQLESKTQKEIKFKIITNGSIQKFFYNKIIQTIVLTNGIEKELIYTTSISKEQQLESKTQKEIKFKISNNWGE